MSHSLRISYLTQRHTGKRPDEIGEHFRSGGSVVCQAGRRIAVQMETNKALAKTIKNIEDYLSKMKT